MARNRSQARLRFHCRCPQLATPPWPCRDRRKSQEVIHMFGKVIAGIAAAGVLAAVLATGVMAAPAAASPSPTTKQRPAAKDAFGGIVTAIKQTQGTGKNAKQGSKTLARQDTTGVGKGRNEKSSRSEIQINSHVLVRYETRDGK